MAEASTMFVPQIAIQKESATRRKMKPPRSQPWTSKAWLWPRHLSN